MLSAKPPGHVYGVCGDGGYDAAELAAWPPAPAPARGACMEWATYLVRRLRILNIPPPKPEQ